MSLPARRRVSRCSSTTTTTSRLGRGVHGDIVVEVSNSIIPPLRDATPLAELIGPVAELIGPVGQRDDPAPYSATRTPYSAPLRSDT
eukprot:scaffold40401_cov70-Phaeocystis_antarctica.AAC.1